MNPEAPGQNQFFPSSLEEGKKETKTKEEAATSEKGQQFEQEKQQIFNNLQQKGLKGTGSWLKFDKGDLDALAKELSTQIMASKVIKLTDAPELLQEYLALIKGSQNPLATVPAQGAVGATAPAAKPSRFKVTQVK